MITANVDKLEEQLKKIHAEVVRKMENMVQGLVADTIVENAVDLTPYGEINDNTRNKYEQRFRSYGWQPQPGLAKGGWEVRLEVGYDSSLSGSPVVTTQGSGGLVYDDSHGSKAKSYAWDDISHYKLGQNVVIINKTPYVAKPNINFGDSLESGYSKQAPDGIMSPLLTAVMSAYSSDLQRYYDMG